MPLAFSFFSSKRATPPQLPSADEVVQPVAEICESGPAQLPATPFPLSPFPSKVMSEVVPKSVSHAFAKGEEADESLPTLILPAGTSPEDIRGGRQPERHAHPNGLAALAMQQSEVAAPPLNRHAQIPSLPMKSGADLSATVPVTDRTVGSGDVSPMPGSVGVLSDETSKEELQAEIEQVKNDLFGAVMGVSALKDRLDGLEGLLQEMQTQVGELPKRLLPSPPQVQGPDRAEVEAWISEWMQERLPAELDRALASAQKRMLAALSTPAFLRPREPVNASERQTFLDQPPAILTSTPA